MGTGLARGGVQAARHEAYAQTRNAVTSQVAETFSQASPAVEANAVHPSTANMSADQWQAAFNPNLGVSQSTNSNYDPFGYPTSSPHTAAGNDQRFSPSRTFGSEQGFTADPYADQHANQHVAPIHPGAGMPPVNQYPNQYDPYGR